MGNGLPGEYILLHDFSHLLITAGALECGRPASSIMERVYAIPQVWFWRAALTAISGCGGNRRKVGTREVCGGGKK